MAQSGAATGPAGGVEEAEDGGRCPVDGAGPVGEEEEDADGDDVIASDAIVGIRKIDAGDGVGVSEGKERRVGEEERGERVLGGLEVELGWECLVS